MEAALVCCASCLIQWTSGVNEGTLLGTPNREPQEYRRNMIQEYVYLPVSLYSIIYLLYYWGSLFGVPSKVPLVQCHWTGGCTCTESASSFSLKTESKALGSFPNKGSPK